MGVWPALKDVSVTQHSKWTAKRVRRGFFGQSIVDFTTASWSSIQLNESSINTASQEHEVQPKKAPRLLRSFAKARIVPGMSQYSDDVGSEEFYEADQDSTAISQRCEFFERSPC